MLWIRRARPNASESKRSEGPHPKPRLDRAIVSSSHSPSSARTPQGAAAMDRFTDIQQIGEGTYGIVYKGYMKGSKGARLIHPHIVCCGPPRANCSDSTRARCGYVCLSTIEPMPITNNLHRERRWPGGADRVETDPAGGRGRRSVRVYMCVWVNNAHASLPILTLPQNPMPQASRPRPSARFPC